MKHSTFKLVHTHSTFHTMHHMPWSSNATRFFLGGNAQWASLKSCCATLLGCGMATSNVCGKDMTGPILCGMWHCSSYSQLWHTHWQCMWQRFDWSYFVWHVVLSLTAQASRMVNCVQKPLNQKCWDKFTCIRIKKLSKIDLSMHIMTRIIAAPMGRGWENDKCGYDQGSFPLLNGFCWSAVACVCNNLYSRPQQQTGPQCWQMTRKCCVKK